MDRVAIPFLVFGILQFVELFEAFLCFDSQAADGRRARRNAAILVAVALSFCIVAASQIRRTDGSAFSDEERQLFGQYLKEHRDTAFLTVPGVLNKMIADLPVAEVSGEAAYDNTIRLASQLSFSENSPQLIVLYVFACPIRYFA